MKKYFSLLILLASSASLHATDVQFANLNGNDSTPHTSAPRLLNHSGPVIEEAQGIFDAIFAESKIHTAINGQVRSNLMINYVKDLKFGPVFAKELPVQMDQAIRAKCLANQAILQKVFNPKDWTKHASVKEVLLHYKTYDLKTPLSDSEVLQLARAFRHLVPMVGNTVNQLGDYISEVILYMRVKRLEDQKLHMKPEYHQWFSEALYELSQVASHTLDFHKVEQNPHNPKMCKLKLPSYHSLEPNLQAGAIYSPQQISYESLIRTKLYLLKQSLAYNYANNSNAIVRLLEFIAADVNIVANILGNDHNLTILLRQPISSIQQINRVMDLYSAASKSADCYAVEAKKEKVNNWLNLQATRAIENHQSQAISTKKFHKKKDETHRKKTPAMEKFGVTINKTYVVVKK